MIVQRFNQIVSSTITNDQSNNTQDHATES